MSLGSSDRHKVSTTRAALAGEARLYKHNTMYSEQETVPIFRIADIPLARIPSPFASSIESSDSGLSHVETKGYYCGFKLPNTVKPLHIETGPEILFSISMCS